MGMLNGAIDNVKQAIEIADQLKNIELKELLITTKEDLLSAKEENLELRDKNRQLLERQSQLDDLELDMHVYWAKNDSDHEQPFCPACYTDGKRSPMQPDRQNTKDTLFRCPANSKHVSNPFDFHRAAAVRSNPYWHNM